MLPEDRLNTLSPHIESMRSNWGIILALGVFLLISGIVAIYCAVFTTFFTVFLLSVLLMVGGVANIVHAFWARRWGGFFYSLLIGILYGLAGFLFFTRPLEAASALTLLMGSFFIIAGLFKIFSSAANPIEHWGWIFFSGVVSLFLGFLVLSDWTSISLWIIGLFIGIDLLSIGWTWIIFALAARSFLKNS
jgi:uncharacterized membrane protein HdeD (DUF308 family)